MKFIVFRFLLLSSSTFAQTVDFDPTELVGSNISRVLEFKEFHKVDNNDNLIFQRHWTGEMLLDSVGNYTGFFNSDPSKFGTTGSDTVFIGNKPKVVLLSNGTVYWYYYNWRMVVKYDSITGTYNRESQIALPDSVVVQNSDQVLATYKYEYTYGFKEISSKQRKIVGEWHFCHHFDNKYVPTGHQDTIVLKRNNFDETCPDLHHLSIKSDGSIAYSSDTLKLEGIPYPENYKEWYFNERGIFFTKKNGLPVDAWKVRFEDNETLFLIFDWDQPK